MTARIARGMKVAATGVLTTVPWLMRRMARELDLRGTLTGSTAGWMYAGYAAQATLYGFALSSSRRQSGRWSRCVGGTLIGTGGVLSVAGMTRFRGGGQVVARTDGDFVTDGVYAATRNPQYLGYLSLLAGGAVARRSVRGLALTAGAAVLLQRWVPVEERHLRRTLGSAYDQYAAATPRWLPPDILISETRVGPFPGVRVRFP